MQQLRLFLPKTIMKGYIPAVYVIQTEKITINELHNSISHQNGTVTGQ